MVKPVDRVHFDLRYKYQRTRDMYGFKYVFFFFFYNYRFIDEKLIRAKK